MKYRTVVAMICLITSAAARCSAEPKPKESSNSVGITMVLIPAGEFLMGSGEAAAEIIKAYPQYGHKPVYYDDELPQHRVRITRPYYIGTCEVTNAQFRQFIQATGYKTQAEREETKDPKGPGGWAFNQQEQKFEGRRPGFDWRHPGFSTPDSQPVVDVSWNDVMAFCRWLSTKEGKKYRLPTEAEWEYAARAGTTTRYWSGDDPESVVKIGNIADGKFFNAYSRYYPKAKTLSGSDGFSLPAPIGSYPANAFGLHDVHGNVWEWTADWYGENYYANSPTDDPQGPSTGRQRVRRGGAWHTAPLYARVTYRNYNTPESRYPNLGFRVVRNAD
jgi:formylglycine-generating enzyme required for sulfatase activity